MLRMTMCASAQAAKSYYREALSRGEYYSNEKILDQEVVGQWGGLGADRLGLEGDVTKAAFERLCDNLHPSTGERLTPRTKDGRRVAYDLNFHVPKSVSLMLELAEDRRIVDAFRSAVRETMKELERDMETRVRREGADASRRTGNMIWAEFIHHTARPIDGVPDPHLHAHCVAFNATYDEAESRWKAADFGSIKTDAFYFQAAYHARMKDNLTQLGYAIERRGDSWEIAGVPESLIRSFSRRTEEIERKASERGITDPETKSRLGASTRESKIAVTSMETLRKEWRDRFQPDQRRMLNEVASRCQNGDGGPTINPAAEHSACLESAIAHVYERQSTAPDRRLLAAALNRTEGGVTPESMEVYVESRIGEGSLMRGSWDGQSLITTPVVHAEEVAMLATVRNGRGAHPPIKPDHEIGDEKLSEEQKAAVRHVLESQDSVSIIRGRAGVGKTRLMKEVVSAIESTGQHVQVVAPTAHATHEVLRGDGFENAQTVAHLVRNPDLRHRVKGQMLWVDEAGLLSVPDMNRLITLASESGARIVLTGDVAQHNSVQRGDALKLLETFSGIQPAEVSRVRRQTHQQYRAACETISRGDIASGFEQLDRMGAIRETADSDRATDLAAEYAASIDRGLDTLVISPTHAEGRRVTEAIRTRLKQDKRLGKTERAVEQLKPRHMTHAEKADAASFRAGDTVEFHQNIKGGFRKGDRADVVGVRAGKVDVRRHRDGVSVALPVQHPDRFAVFENTQLPIAKGDQVRITQNGRTKDNRHRLNNGSIYTVTGFTRSGDIKLENGWTVPKQFGHISHGYCVTSDASQGRGVRHVIIAQSAESAPASSIQQFYTSVTRGKSRVTVFTDDKTRLLRAVSRDASRVSATQLLAPAVNPPREIGMAHRQAIGAWLQFRHAQELGRRGRDRATRQVVRVVRRRRRRDRGLDRGL